MTTIVKASPKLQSPSPTTESLDALGLSRARPQWPPRPFILTTSTFGLAVVVVVVPRHLNLNRHVRINIILGVYVYSFRSSLSVGPLRRSKAAARRQKGTNQFVPRPMWHIHWFAYVLYIFMFTCPSLTELFSPWSPSSGSYVISYPGRLMGSGRSTRHVLYCV